MKKVTLVVMIFFMLIIITIGIVGLLFSPVHLNTNVGNAVMMNTPNQASENLTVAAVTQYSFIQDCYINYLKAL